jgi:hypothetical protein
MLISSSNTSFLQFLKNFVGLEIVVLVDATNSSTIVQLSISIPTETVEELLKAVL